METPLGSSFDASMEDTRGGDGGGRATKTVRLREDDPLDISDMMGDNSIDSCISFKDKLMTFFSVLN